MSTSGTTTTLARRTTSGVVAVTGGATAVTIWPHRVDGGAVASATRKRGRAVRVSPALVLASVNDPSRLADTAALPLSA
ncbi:MAG: hypothetical protein U0Q15_17055 [Kineosporiaceae bacterium]